jgi:hypothetical protein
MPRYDDVSSKRIRFGKPVTEARCEYTATEKLVKRNFSTTFSCTFTLDFVENFVETACSRPQHGAGSHGRLATNDQFGA